MKAQSLFYHEISAIKNATNSFLGVPVPNVKKNGSVDP